MMRKKLAYSLISFALAATLAGAAYVNHSAGKREAVAEAAFPPEGRILDVNGTRVHAVVEGNGPDLILIHGASGNLRDFTYDFIDRIKDRYRVIAFDRPGLGWTDRIGDRFNGTFNTASETPYAQADLLYDAARQLGVTRPIVLGHSYGGAIALAWALDHPEDTGALVVLAGATNPWPGGLGPLYAINSSALGGSLFTPLLTAFAPQSQLQQTIDSIFAPQSAPEGYTQYVGAGLTVRRASLRANAQQVSSLRPHVVEMSKIYHTINIPVEIVHGTADTIVPLEVHSEPLSRQIPGAHLTQLDGVGHMPHHAAPQAVIDAIDRAAMRAQLR